MTTTTCKPWSIVLVPRPLTPFAAFAWYAISELLPPGALGLCEKRFFRWIDVTHPRGKLHSPYGVILNLNADRGIMEREIVKWLLCKLLLVAVPRNSNSKSLAVREFVFYGSHRQGEPQKNWSEWERWFRTLSEIYDPETVLEFSNMLFRKIIDEQKDPRRAEVDFPFLPPVPAPAVLPKVTSVIKVTMPVVKKRGPSDAKIRHRKAIDYSIKSLPEQNIFRLLGQHLLIAVGGPSGSGKSTVVPSLLIEMRNIIDSLRSRGGDWEKLNLTVDISSLDAATPVSDSVILSKATSRSKMRALKREWTLDLAQEAVAESEKKIATANIILADLPGKITNITESLSAFATFGGIVTNDWEAKREWRPFFEHIKAPILFQVKSSDAQSLVTTYQPGTEILGRIHKLNRVMRGWDPFVLTLAQFLLFDILPSRIRQSQNKPIDWRHREDDCITVQLH